MKIAPMVVTAVISTERATSPCAMYVHRLLTWREGSRNKGTCDAFLFLRTGARVSRHCCAQVSYLASVDRASQDHPGS